jgi:hypothetical protein
MSDVTLKQVIKLVDQLNEADREALLKHLRNEAVAQNSSVSGNSQELPSILGLFAEPRVDLSEEELRAGIKQFGKEWEEELDELKPDES